MVLSVAHGVSAKRWGKQDKELYLKEPGACGDSNMQGASGLFSEVLNMLIVLFFLLMTAVWKVQKG